MNEPLITITTAYSECGWTTTVTMPDGQTYAREMKCNGNYGGMYKATRKGDFEDDGLPECVCEVANNMGHTDVVRFLNNGDE